MRTAFGVDVQQPPPQSAAPTVVVATVVALSATLLVFSNGLILVALVPVVVLALAYGIWSIPVRTSVLVLFAVALVVDVPSENPAAGRWRSPFYPIGALLFDNLNNVFPVSALRFSGLDLLLVTLLAILLLRSTSRWRPRPLETLQTPNALSMALVGCVASIACLEAYGLARGGDFKNSLWQVRPILWLPVLAGLMSYAIRGARHITFVRRAVIAAACIKTLIGLYFLIVVARGWPERPAYVTHHSDSVLFCAGIAGCIASWVHRPTLSRLALMVFTSAWIALGILANNRRLAFVGLFAALAVIVIVLERGPLKRAVMRTVVASIPFLIVYIMLGRTHKSGIFAPAASVWSVTSQSDASSATRDIENYNLIMTLKPNPILGTGFGHEYKEVSKAYDISGAFAQYRYIAHNSVLWLWSIAGFVGFTIFSFMLVVTVFLARRAYAFARTPDDRTAALWALAVVPIYLAQVWGDMGLNGWVVDFVFAAVMAVAGKVAVSTGAWPTRGSRSTGAHAGTVAKPSDGTLDLRQPT